MLLNILKGLGGVNMTGGLIKAGKRVTYRSDCFEINPLNLDIIIIKVINNSKAIVGILALY
jgi:hypothetical protein